MIPAAAVAALVLLGSGPAWAQRAAAASAPAASAAVSRTAADAAPAAVGTSQQVTVEGTTDADRRRKLAEWITARQGGDPHIPLACAFARNSLARTSQNSPSSLLVAL